MQEIRTKQFRYSLSVFLPFYNEEKNIRAAVGDVADTLSGLSALTDYEIIIVDDGSTDGTGRIARALVSANPHIRLVTHPVNKGYGEALKSGIAAARFDYVFFTDGDMQFDIHELPRLLAYIPRYQAVLGYRALRRDPLMRLVNAWGWNTLNKIVFGLSVRDIDCAFKLFKREVIERLALVSSGAMISAEILIRLSHEGVAFREVPVTHLPRHAGSPTGAKLTVIMRAFRELFLVYATTDLGRPILRQAMRFAGIGVINTLTDVLVYLFLTRGMPVFGTHIIAVRVISFLSGSVVSFFLNRRWTFGVRGSFSGEEFAKFYSTVLVGLLVGTISMKILVEYLGVYDVAALLLSVIATFVWNFIMNKVWVFAHRNTPPVPSLSLRDSSRRT